MVIEHSFSCQRKYRELQTYIYTHTCARTHTRTHTSNYNMIPFVAIEFSELDKALEFTTLR